MKQRKLIIQAGFGALALLLSISAVGCDDICPTPTPPPPPETNPANETQVEAGTQLPVRASAAGAEGYRWELFGGGSLSTTEGETTIYTAPKEVPKGGVMVQLNVTAYNDGGESPSTALIITIKPPTGSVQIIPTTNIRLGPGGTDCPDEDAWGEIGTTGELEISGLEPNKRYYLTLNGKLGVPPNEKLCIMCRDAGCDNTSTSGCWWDFDSITTDDNGTVSKPSLVVVLPPGVDFSLGQTYEVKFFVKNTAFCTVLQAPSFTFRFEKVE